MSKLYSRASEGDNMTIKEVTQEDNVESKDSINFEENVEEKSNVSGGSSKDSSKGLHIDLKSSEVQSIHDIQNVNPFYKLNSVMNFSHSLTNNQADRETSELMLNLNQMERNENSGELRTSQDKFEKRLLELDKKIKCGFWKENYKQNHIIEFEGLYDGFIPGTTKNGGMKDWEDKEKIEQLIFDPRLGMVKREIYFGVVNYTTTFNLKQSIDKRLRKSFQERLSLLHPEIYSNRLLEFADYIFK